MTYAHFWRGGGSSPGETPWLCRLGSTNNPPAVGGSEGDDPGSGGLEDLAVAADPSGGGVWNCHAKVLIRLLTEGATAGPGEPPVHMRHHQAY